MPHLFLNSSTSQGLLISIHMAGRKAAGKQFSTQSTFYEAQKKSTSGDAHLGWVAGPCGEYALRFLSCTRAPSQGHSW